MRGPHGALAGAQDGKFFEASWAFSLGPTAGVLIGVGPFEVMAETQLRFMGGLSDVDWLVEEGLRVLDAAGKVVAQGPVPIAPGPERGDWEGAQGRSSRSGSPGQHRASECRGRPTSRRCP